MFAFKLKSFDVKVVYGVCVDFPQIILTGSQCMFLPARK